jgi:hypothetical protein
MRSCSVRKSTRFWKAVITWHNLERGVATTNSNFNCGAHMIMFYEELAAKWPTAYCIRLASTISQLILLCESRWLHRILYLRNCLVCVSLDLNCVF